MVPGHGDLDFFESNTISDRDMRGAKSSERDKIPSGEDFLRGKGEHTRPRGRSRSGNCSPIALHSARPVTPDFLLGTGPGGSQWSRRKKPSPLLLHAKTAGPSPGESVERSNVPRVPSSVRQKRDQSPLSSTLTPPLPRTSPPPLPPPQEWRGECEDARLSALLNRDLSETSAEAQTESTRLSNGEERERALFGRKAQSGPLMASTREASRSRFLDSSSPPATLACSLPWRRQTSVSPTAGASAGDTLWGADSLSRKGRVGRFGASEVHNVRHEVVPWGASYAAVEPLQTAEEAVPNSPPQTQRSRGGDSSSEGEGGGRVIVIGVKVRVEAEGRVCDLEPQSKEAMAFALSKLAKKGDVMVALYVHRARRGEWDVHEMTAALGSELAAWEAVGEAREVTVEGRVLMVEGKATSAFAAQASALKADLVLLSCSLATLAAKHLLGVRRHKWGDACTRHMSQSCSVIVARKGIILASAKGRCGSRAPPPSRHLSRLENGGRSFSYAELASATSNFQASCAAPQGAAMEHASLATFPPGSEQGVAHLYLCAHRADHRAMARLRRELQGWRGRAHANLASVRNYHLTHRRCAVVVDLYANGTLHHALHSPGSPLRLTWAQRVQIALQVGCAILFCHCCGGSPLMHFAVQSGNVLLGANLEAKVTNFWTGALLPAFLLPHRAGPPGYGCSQAERRVAVSERADVFAFGVILWELLTGQAPDRLVHARPLCEGGEYRELLDPRLLPSYNLAQVAAVAQLASVCTHTNPRRRPSMARVRFQVAARWWACGRDGRN